MSESNQMFDYVIVGAGSAGCILANRLSEDPAVRVCLVEAGPRDTHPLIKIPAGVAGIVGNKVLNWGYKTVPQPSLNDRQINVPRGRVLGGSSSLNGMVYFRGNQEDFNNWARLGNVGWGYQDLLPYFIRNEANNKFTDPVYHGTKGPMAVSSYHHVNPLVDSFLAAAASLQYPQCEDFNGASSEGFGVRQANIRNGRRESTATGYLQPASGRSNLKVVTGALVDSIRMEGKRATGINLFHDGVKEILSARREVLVCCGSYGSPALLQRSGIGPAELLKSVGIEVRHELRGVGENLQDHIVAPVQMKTDDPTSYGVSLRVLPRLAWNLLEYVFARRGLLASNLFEATGMVRSTPEVSLPDLQMIFMPAHRNASGFPIPFGHGYGILNVLLQPKSRGNVRIASKAPQDAPLIDPKFFDDESDFEPLLRGVDLSRRLFANPAFAAMKAVEILPGPNVQGTDEIKASIRQTAVTVHHPIGTCKMGQDADAVVDTQLRVHGIDGLRVIDGSVMPLVVRGNTAASIMAIAEKASDLIRGLT